MEKSANLIPPHGGYKNLISFQMATIVYDLTVAFCNRYKSYLTNKTHEQMTGAGRSGKQNIAEGSINSGTSKKMEMKLTQVSRGSLGELLEDYEDFLRQNDLKLWSKDDPRSQKIRALAYRSNKSYKTYMSFLRKPEEAANCLICLIHQTNYLLDLQARSQQKEFLEKGGFTENLYSARRKARNK